MRKFIIIGILLGTVGLITKAYDTPKTTNSYKLPSKNLSDQSIGNNVSQFAEFDLRDIYGKKVKLKPNKTKVYIVDFWATWCPPCKAEIPHFMALQKKYGSQGLNIIGISSDKTIEPVKIFKKQTGINYPIIMNTAEIRAPFGKIKAIPTTFVLDSEFNIIDKALGYRDYSYFENIIVPLL